MPKIAIDISPLNDGNAVRGVGYYTSRLVKAIESEVCHNKDYSDYQIQLISTADELKNNKFDLIHYPYFDPFKLTLPKNPSAPFLITIHDLIPLEFKTHFPVGIKGTIKWQIQKFLAKKAKYLITPSHYSKHSISQILNYPADHIYVTYEGADPEFMPRKHSSKFNEIKTKYNLPDKFVFYLGDINWNKNLPSLVNACLEKNYPLVIVGSAATKKAPVHPWTTDIHWLQETHRQVGGNDAGKIILTGFVPDEDLPYFFNLATLYCQPSYAEGFGLAILQAMQSGCPVVHADRGAMAEIVDYSGVMFNPDNNKSLSHALSSLWTDPTLCQQCITKGLQRAKVFSWQLAALQTLAVYKLALIDEKH